MTLASGPARDAAMAALARPGGAFAIVAIDQRESLRTMLTQISGVRAPDDDLISFKRAVIRSLSVHASAFLLDRDYALGPAVVEGELDPACGRIVAADKLIQAPGGQVEGTELDPGVVDLAVQAGATALKLLVLWHPDRGRAERSRLVTDFVAVCRDSGLLSLVEGVVRPPAGASAEDTWLLSEGILEAAGELTGHEPDLYKAQVPTLGEGPAEEIEALSERMTAIVGRPWVVLSSGVAHEKFAGAVEASCRGGASGFLAGRAIWTGALEPSHRVEQLEGRAADLLVRLGAIVDESARPWTRAVADSVPALTTGPAQP